MIAHEQKRSLHDFELEDPLDCWFCKGLYDLRFWRVLSDDTMQCPECKMFSNIDEAIELTRRKTRAWFIRRIGTGPAPDPVREEVNKRMENFKRGGVL